MSKQSKKPVVPEPEEGLKFVDAHCHLPFPRPKNDTLASDEEQYRKFFAQGGVYLISCSIDIETLRLIEKFMKSSSKNFGFTCGWAPQTVTYTPKEKYSSEWNEWVDYIKNNKEKYLAIGEIGLDFHHAKALEKREKQVEEFRKILELTKGFDKPYVLHVRNAAEIEKDYKHTNHRFNDPDGANKEILSVLKELNVNPKKVMWHCFSGPTEYGTSLWKQGFTISVPSSAFGFTRWRENSKGAPLESLVTETDSYYQHPYLRGPVNEPVNVRYSIAAIAYAKNITQKVVSEATVSNAMRFFNLKLS